MARTGPGIPSFPLQDVCVNCAISFCESRARQGGHSPRENIKTEQTQSSTRWFGIRPLLVRLFLLIAALPVPALSSAVYMVKLSSSTEHYTHGVRIRYVADLWRDRVRST